MMDQSLHAYNGLICTECRLAIARSPKLLVVKASPTKGNSASSPKTFETLLLLRSHPHQADFLSGPTKDLNLSENVSPATDS